MQANACAICVAPNTDEIEKLGLAAQNEEISWREAARQANLSHHRVIQNHMAKHYVSDVDRELSGLDDELHAAIEDAVRELLERARTAPGDVRPLLLSAAHNLRSLQETKPSQQHLIMALKTAQEMTGMKQEQRLMLEFAGAMFQKKRIEATHQPILEIEALESG